MSAAVAADIELTNEGAVTRGGDGGGEGGNGNNQHLGHGDKDDKFAEDYERLLSKVRWVALAGNALYSFNRFVGYCALTWSMAVVLGAILPSISKEDYYFVAALLLLEAVRLSLARLFRLIVLQKVFYVTTDPRMLVYHSDAKQKLLFWIRCTEQIVQLLLVFASLVLSVLRILSIPESSSPSSSRGKSGTAPSPTSDNSDFNVDVASLRIFYWLVLVNAFVFGILSFFKPILLHAVVKKSVEENPHEMSLLKYDDHIVWLGTQQGFVQSCADVDILSFAFQVQAEGYRSNERAPTVMQNYRQLMRYLCCHPRFKGFEKASKLLESADPYEVEAAANVVGCWIRITESGNKCKTLILQRKLLKRLADTLAHEESGRAATSSFEALAEYDPAATARVRNSEGHYLADILMDMIHDLVEMGKPDKAVVLIKVWNLLMPVIFVKKDSFGEDSSIAEIESTSELVTETESTDSSDRNSMDGQELASAEELAAQGVDDVTKYAQTVKVEAEAELMQLNLNATHELKSCNADKVVTLLHDLVRIVTKHPGALKRTQAVAAYGLRASGAFRTGGPAMEGVKKLLCMEPSCQNNAGKEHILPYEYDCVYYVIHGRYDPDRSTKGNLDLKKELPELNWRKDKIKFRDPLRHQTPPADEILTKLLRVGPAVVFCAGALVAMDFLLAQPVSSAIWLLFSKLLS